MATCTLTIASQNVGMGAGQRISKAAAQTLALEDDTDLLCMQEGRPLRSGQFEDNASMVALNTAFTLLGDGPYLTRVRQDPSLEAASHELALYTAQDLTNPGTAAKYETRTFQQVIVRKGGRTILILNVHCRCGNAMDTATEFRKLALRRVKAHAEQLLSAGQADAAVIVGDFNLSDSQSAAILCGNSWMVEHIVGGIRNNGERYHDLIAFSTSLAAVRAARVACALSHGDGQLSDAHGAGKLVLTLDLPAARWTRYRAAAADGSALWWAKGRPQTDEMLDFFLEESASERGWSLTQRGELPVWSNHAEFFFVASGYSFLL